MVPLSSANPPMMKHTLFNRALLLACVALLSTSVLAFAEGPAIVATTNGQGGTAVVADSNLATVAPEHWTSYGFNITAPRSMWPMLELLHAQKFDWELASATLWQTPIQWATMAPGSYGQYARSLNTIKLSWVLQNDSVEVATAFLAHELTHLTDDINGKLGDMTGDLCYEAETRAFVNEANFWQMVVGPMGKPTNSPIETQENTKMFAFVGNPRFADLVVRTTASYVKQCGVDHSR